jgi:arabinose-5-phosphate isomerase
MRTAMQHNSLQSNTDTHSDYIKRGKQTLHTEANAIKLCAENLDGNFAQAVETVLHTKGRIVVTGMGKSGHIARKIAATMASTGTPAIYIHPGEAAHGDLGMLLPDDTLMMLSYSGSTTELKPVIDYAQHLQCKIICVSAQKLSAMMQAAHVKMLLPHAPEACPANIAPTTSTTMMLALGDALALAVMSSRGVNRDALMMLHPGGNIGSRLSTVGEIMHTGDRMPLVLPNAPMKDVVFAMTGKSLGIAGVVDHNGRLIGIISDGDLRRSIDKIHSSTAREVMTENPKTIAETCFAEDAIALMTHNKITALFVMSAEDEHMPVGVVHIHDFSRLGLIQANV